MTTVYHGTVTGKDDLFLESFIITGAISNHSYCTGGQRDGFFVTLDQQLILDPYRSYGSSRPEKLALGPNSYGHGICVEIDTSLDVQSWDFDHHMGYIDSLGLIIDMEKLLPEMKLTGKDAELVDQFIDGLKESAYSWENFYIHHTKSFIVAGALKEISEDIIFRYPYPGVTEIPCLSTEPTPVLEKMHDLLKTSFPAEYDRAKQKRLDEMSCQKTGILKYIGKSPLKVSRIRLRPEDDSAAKKLENWKLIYQADGAKPVTAVQTARQIVAQAPPVS